MRDDEPRPDAGSSGQVEVFETAETSRVRLLAGLAIIGLGVFAFLALTLPEVFPPGWLEQLFGLAASPPDLPRRLLGLLAGPLIAAGGVFLLAVARYARGVRITVREQGVEYLDRHTWLVAAWPEVYSLAEHTTPDGGKAYTVATAHGDFHFQSRTLPAADRLAALIRRRIKEDSHD
jgi:hypothetical protein